MKNKDRYQVLEELGRGSFGTVYRGIDKLSGETVALKQIDLEASEDDIQEIQQEISVLSTCASSFVVQYKESFLDRTDLWIVMEYLGGGSCLDLLKAGNFGETHIAIICRELLLGLEYLHAEGKIHRDIKAANVLLSEAGRVKLADFGVAAQLTNITSQRCTFVGTPYWMAPEVIEQAGYDVKADIWSLGVTAMEFARGEPPHAEMHPMKVLLQIPKLPPPRLEGGEHSKDLKNFVAQCLMKESDLRPSAKELLKHRFIRNAGKTEALQELVQRKRLWDASQSRAKHPVFYQETLRTLAPPKDDVDAWVFETVKSVAALAAPTANHRKSKVRPHRPSATPAVEESMRKLDVGQEPLQLPTPATVRRSTVRRRPSSQLSSRRGSATETTGPPRASIPSGPPPARRPLQPDMSFGNSGSSVRLFRRVPSDGSSDGHAMSSPELHATNENRPPPALLAAPVAPTSKESLLGRRLYTCALEPTLAELHAQTATPAKREALARLSDAFAVLDGVDSEGSYHFFRNLAAMVAQDGKLGAALLQPALSAKAVAALQMPPALVRLDDDVKDPQQQSPTKPLLSLAKPLLLSQRSRRHARFLAGPSASPDKDRESREFQREKMVFEAKLPGRAALSGMEHVSQLSEVLYARWANGLKQRWGGRSAMAGA